MDNNYIVKLGPEAFALLHIMVEEQITNTDQLEILSAKNLPLLEAWAAIQRADQDHQCVDDGYQLLV